MQYIMEGVVSSFTCIVLLGKQSKLSLEQQVEDFGLLCVYLYVCIHCDITCKEYERVLFIIILVR